MTQIVDITALVLGYIVMGSGSVFMVYWITGMLAEIIIQSENRFFVAIKVQAGIMKYFKNKEKIDSMLRDKKNEEQP